MRFPPSSRTTLERRPGAKNSREYSRALPPRPKLRRFRQAGSERVPLFGCLQLDGNFQRDVCQSGKTLMSEISQIKGRCAAGEFGHLSTSNRLAGPHVAAAKGLGNAAKHTPTQ